MDWGCFGGLKMGWGHPGLEGGLLGLLERSGDGLEMKWQSCGAVVAQGRLHQSIFLKANKGVITCV